LHGDPVREAQVARPDLDGIGHLAHQRLIRPVYVADPCPRLCRSTGLGLLPPRTPSCFRRFRAPHRPLCGLGWPFLPGSATHVAADPTVGSHRGKHRSRPASCVRGRAGDRNTRSRHTPCL
jgi:hypothetical protein